MFHGSLVALVTPMTVEGSIDYAALERLVAWHLTAGTDGLVILGTTGESPTVTASERQSIVQQVIAEVNGRIPVVVGTGANATHHALELTEQALHWGADAALLVTPYYNKPTQEGLYQHYLTIAEAVPIPQILYNVPGRTGCDLLPSTVERLCQQANNIVAIKETNPDLTRIQQLINCGIDVLSGDDYLAYAYMQQGAKGVISVTANLLPSLVHQLAHAALQGDWDMAEQQHQALEQLNQQLFLESNPIPVKWALEQMGLIAAGIRLPLTWLSSQYHSQLRDTLQQMGCLKSGQSH